jgi:2-hydroxychromene-2-carboxylate isomerase
VNQALEQPVFYYDLGSPACYLAAEQIVSALPVVAEWEPVPAPSNGGLGVELDRRAFERLAADRGLLEIRWPRAWPPDAHRALLAATYAKKAGRVVAFSLAAFRQAFAGGRDLGDDDTVLIAAAACEMHPVALLKGMELRSTAAALDTAAARALASGVRSLPAIVLGTRVFEGARAIELASLALGT